MNNHYEIFNDEETFQQITEFAERAELPVDYVIDEFVLDNLFVPVQEVAQES